MNVSSFDESKVHWQRLPDLDHLWPSILDVGETAKVVDVLFKFAANQKIVLHRHVAASHTFVVQGEHRIDDSSGDLKEVRSVGAYKAGQPDEEPHAECGGDTDVVILFSLRPYNGGAIYEILDENHEMLSTITFDGMKELFDAA